MNTQAPALRPYLVRHQSETAETRVDAKNPADAAELHGGIAQNAGVCWGAHFEVRMYDGTTTYVRPGIAQ